MLGRESGRLYFELQAWALSTLDVLEACWAMPRRCCPPYIYSTITIPGQATTKFGVGSSSNTSLPWPLLQQAMMPTNSKDEHPEIKEQVANRGWRRLTNPRTQISKLLTQEFYANATRTDDQLRSTHPYKSYVRGVDVDFSAKNLKEVLRIRENTPGAEIDFITRQTNDQRLDEVLQELCVPGVRWKLSSSTPLQPIQLKRQDLFPLARGWHEFIIHSLTLLETSQKSQWQGQS
ncbi:hypothetical protein PIB30_091240 [Stylosanthes scabra]|uniref:Putative plant transposon protein domain-containing protein n=1 Tax=Stylosanthes scabra TaxID=79078 RepID=A0ABU6WXT7_9FABA|nr:hypothetical protein [Stylosanthes scabra]